MSPASIRRRALLLFVLASAAVSDATTLECQNDCDYGILPGLWRDQGKPQWQLVSQCCQLRDLVGEARHAPADWNSTEDEDPAVRILIFGDSVERITLHDLCDQDQWDNWGHDQTLFHSCRRGRVLLSRQSMIGVNPDGPYHMGMTGSPFQRILNGFASHRAFTGYEPDAVVFSSFLWDMQRWGHYEPDRISGKELDPATLAEWSGQFLNVLRFIQENSPEAAVRVFKTTVPPLTKDCASSEGRFQVAEMGRKGHVLALNAVAKGVAAAEGWATVDMSQVTGYFSEREYLRDMHHPARQISLTALNLLLNVVFSRVEISGRDAVFTNQDVWGSY